MVVFTIIPSDGVISIYLQIKNLNHATVTTASSGHLSPTRWKGLVFVEQGQIPAKGEGGVCFHQSHLSVVGGIVKVIIHCSYCMVLLAFN